MTVQTQSPLPRKKTPNQMNFTKALEEAMQGRRITRVEWGTSEIYGLMRDRILKLRKVDGQYYDWIISEGDLLATDWTVLPEAN